MRYANSYINNNYIIIIIIITIIIIMIMITITKWELGTLEPSFVYPASRGSWKLPMQTV